MSVSEILNINSAWLEQSNCLETWTMEFVY